MSAWRMSVARIRGVFRKNRAGYLNEELREHTEMLAADYRRNGMTETDAHYAALRDLGNVTSMQEEYREQNGLPVLENFWLDLKYAFRTLRRNPAFTVSCIATLMLGLGAMITVICVVSAFFWKPLPYPNPERLVVIKEVDPRSGLWSFSEPALLDVQERSKSLSAVAAYQQRSVALTGTGEPEIVQAAAVTPSFFPMFGIKPIAGTIFHNSLPYVFISRRFFERKWQMDPTVVGRSILLDGASYSVAGVGDLPGDLLPGVDVLLPLDPKATESRSAHEVEVAGRLRAGVAEGQAQAELSSIAAGIAREHAQTNAGWGMRIVPLAQFVVGAGTARMVWMIFAAVALLWLLACANVAGLQMARSIARGHEISTRLALGASRGRLLGQTITESVVLAVAGGLLGMVAAQGVIGVIRRLGAEFLPRVADVRMDAGAVFIATGCMLVSTVLFGLFSGRTPTFQSGRELARRDRGRDALIVAQVALASVLLLGASLLFQSFLRLRAVDPGFNPEKILNVRVNLPSRTASDLQQVLNRLPDVEASGATNVIPFGGQGTANRFRLEAEASSAEFHSAAWRAVTPGFFATLRLPLKRGRLFTEADRNGSLEVVILSESMARQFWPNQDPIGKRLLWGRSGSPKTIVGVVGDLRDLTLDASPAPIMFRPYAQLSDAPMTLVVRTKGEPTAAIADIRRGIWAVNRDAALEFQPLREAMAHSILDRRASLLAVAAFAFMAMITAAFGLYGLISYRVNQRQQEIGIRLALGSPAYLLRWTVQKRCLLLVCGGLAIGLPLAGVLSRLMRALLYETQPTQASAYVMVVLAFLAVAFAASFGPARRAARMDPSAAIRHE